MSEAYRLAMIKYGDIVTYRTQNGCGVGEVEGWHWRHGQHNVLLVDGGVIPLGQVLERRRWRTETIVFEEQFALERINL